MKDGVLIVCEGAEKDEQSMGWIQRAVKFVGKPPENEK